MPFSSNTNNHARLASSAANLTELITEIESRFPALRKHLRGEDGQIRRFINFYVTRKIFASWVMKNTVFKRVMRC